jgi:GntR family transcriptional regulator
LIRERMQRWLEMEPPGHWLVIEPDEELRRIVMTEMEQAVRLPVRGCGPDDCRDAQALDGTMPVVLPSKAAAVRKLLPAGAELTVLQVHPVAPELSSYLPAPPGVLVGIASRWGEFQRVARTMLIAAGIAPESLLVCDAAKPGWKRGLAETAAVVCDAVTCPELPKGCRAIEFRLLAEGALEHLRTTEGSLVDPKDSKAGSSPSPHSGSE